MKGKRLANVILCTGMFLLILMFSACTDNSEKINKEQVLAEFNYEELQISLVRTADTKAKVCVEKGEDKTDVYRIRAINTREECLFEQGNALGKNTILLTYHSCPTSYDTCDREKVFILFEIAEKRVTPIALGKSTFFEIDCDGDGVNEIITNYSKGWDSDVIVYDSDGEKVVCADPAEAIKDLYGLHTEGVHLPYDFLKEASSNDLTGKEFGESLTFESNNYIGVRVAYTDLVFREMNRETLVNKVLSRDKNGYVEENTKVIRNVSLNMNIKGAFVMNTDVGYILPEGYGSRFAFAIPYEVKLSEEGRIEEVNLKKMDVVWGSLCWNILDEAELPLISAVIPNDFNEEWKVVISEDKLSASIEGHFDLKTEYYSPNGLKLKETALTSYKTIELLLPN